MTEHSKGYAKGKRESLARIAALEAECASLQERPANDTVEYLITSAAALLVAARTLAEMRAEVPNA
jgi:hypothetical protein